MSTLDKIKQLIKDQALSEQVKAHQLQSLEIINIQMPQITGQIKKQIQKCKMIQALSIVDCGLESLDNLPVLENISAIDLSKNKLSDNQVRKLCTYQLIQQIMLDENNISKLQTIKSFSRLSNLQQVQFSNNPVAGQENYREFVFKNLQNVVYLDGKDKDGNDIPEEQEFDDQDDQDDDQDGDAQDDDQDAQDDDEDVQDDDQDQDQSPQPTKRK